MKPRKSDVLAVAREMERRGWFAADDLAISIACARFPEAMTGKTSKYEDGYAAYLVELPEAAFRHLLRTREKVIREARRCCDIGVKRALHDYDSARREMRKGGGK